MACRKDSPQEISEIAIDRAKSADVTVTRWCHCVSRSVRKGFLLRERDGNREEWLENRLEGLAEIFAIEIEQLSSPAGSAARCYHPREACLPLSYQSAGSRVRLRDAPSYDGKGCECEREREFESSVR
jgi:hypothetical protein